MWLDDWEGKSRNCENFYLIGSAVYEIEKSIWSEKLTCESYVKVGTSVKL